MNWSLIFYYKYKVENYHLYNEIKLEPDVLFWWIIHICGGYYGNSFGINKAD